MIIKETDKKILNDKYKKSGFEAEKQMSFYLKRAFADDDSVYVLNDLRIHVEDEYAQIDHLIVHTAGFIIIESKSVTDTICINRYEEWTRIYNNKETGIPSPIKQAKRQIEILKKFLLSQDKSKLFRETLVNKISPPSIEKLYYDVLVAISDSGIIKRDNIELSEICKADSINEHIENLYTHHKKEFYKILNINAVRLHKDSIAKIAKLLLLSHSPIQKEPNPKEPIVKKPIVTTKIIPKKSTKINKNQQISTNINKYHRRYSNYL